MWAWVCVFSRAAMGLSTSFVFKYLNNMVYLFIQGCCLFAVAALSVVFFHFKFSPLYVVALVLITAAIGLYNTEKIRAFAATASWVPACGLMPVPEWCCGGQSGGVKV